LEDPKISSGSLGRPQNSFRIPWKTPRFLQDPLEEPKIPSRSLENFQDSLETLKTPSRYLENFKKKFKKSQKLFPFKEIH
jgi:hypothetical protein